MRVMADPAMATNSTRVAFVVLTLATKARMAYIQANREVLPELESIAASTSAVDEGVAAAAAMAGASTAPASSAAAVSAAAVLESIRVQSDPRGAGSQTWARAQIALRRAQSRRRRRRRSHGA